MAKSATELRVAMFHTSLPASGRKLGGVEVTVHRLANSLICHEGCAVTMFSNTKPPTDALYKHCWVGASGAAASRVRRLLWLPMQLNWVDFSSFDVLHLHGDDWFFIRRNLPTVRTLHGSALFEARFARSLPRKLLQYAVYPLEHLSARLATLPLAVGTEAARLYRTAGLSDNGVDTALFRPRVKSAEPLLLYVGLWGGRKRGAYAFELFAKQVAPRWPTARLRMVCDYVPDHPQVESGGFPSDETLAEWMASAWVFFYPSLYEGFGIPYIEAMASGTAVVTSPNSGANYVLDGGRAGVILSDDELAAGLDRLLHDGVARQLLEAAGLARAARFSWLEVSRQHVALYRDAMTRFNG